MVMHSVVQRICQTDAGSEALVDPRINGEAVRAAVRMRSPCIAARPVRAIAHNRRVAGPPAGAATLALRPDHDLVVNRLDALHVRDGIFKSA